MRINTFNSVWSWKVVSCVFKVYTLFQMKRLIKFISFSNHYTLKTWPRGLYLCYLIPPCKIQSLPYCWHTNTYLSHPPAPTHSMLSTNRKSVNSQAVRTNCAFQHWMGERGCVWANDLWQWLSILDNLRSQNHAFGSIMKELEFLREKRVLL